MVYFGAQAIPINQVIELYPQIIIDEERTRFNETQPLTFFYHSCISWKHAIARLKKKPNSQSRQSSVHYQQRLLLDSLHLIYMEMDERIDRSYLDYLSNQDKEELLSGFNESVFYHAMTLYYNLAPDLQLITDLRESGQHLFSIFNLTLIEINQRTMVNPLPPYKDLFPTLRRFDLAWTEFEKHLCQWMYRYSPRGMISKQEDISMFQILMNETINRCVKSGILDRDACLECDPLVMISLPRLCFVSGLVYNKNLLPMTDLECELNWFRMDMDLLVDISNRLLALNDQELHDLQYLLVSNKGQNRFVDIYKDICLVASNLTSRRAAVLADVLRNAIEQLDA